MALLLLFLDYLAIVLGLAHIMGKYKINLHSLRNKTVKFVKD